MLAYNQFQRRPAHYWTAVVLSERAAYVADNRARAEASLRSAEAELSRAAWYRSEAAKMQKARLSLAS